MNTRVESQIQEESKRRRLHRDGTGRSIRQDGLPAPQSSSGSRRRKCSAQYWRRAIDGQPMVNSGPISSFFSAVLRECKAPTVQHEVLEEEKASCILTLYWKRKRLKSDQHVLALQYALVSCVDETFSSMKWSMSAHLAETGVVSSPGPFQGCRDCPRWTNAVLTVHFFASQGVLCSSAHPHTPDNSEPSALLTTPHHTLHS